MQVRDEVSDASLGRVTTNVLFGAVGGGAGGVGGLAAGTAAKEAGRGAVNHFAARTGASIASSAVFVSAPKYVADGIHQSTHREQILLCERR
jgi:hypothetical protein